MKVSKKFLDTIGKLPIFKKIALTYGGIFSISLILISLFVSASTSLFFAALNYCELKEAAIMVQNHIETGGAITSQSLAEINTNPMIEINVIKYISGTSTITIVSSPPNSAFFQKLFESQKILSSGFSTVTIDKQKVEYYQQVLTYEDNLYKIQTFRLAHQEEKQLKFIYIIFIIANLIGVFVSFIIGLYISKKMLKPIKDIRNTAERISIEDLSQRIDIPKSNDDLKDLAVTFNDMIDRLDKSFRKQNQFVADASHELRTPISVIQGYANLIDRWGKSDPDVLQESIDSIKSETEHMSKLVKRLLFLAKSDQNKLPIQKDIINLNDIASEISKEIDIMQISQNFILNLDKEEINIVADYSLIKQMLWVFIENSIKYTDAKKNIILSVFKDNNYAYISVCDEGRGIPQEDIPYIFNRFYRVDKSRNKDIPGTGLGLSIANWIAQQHNAKIRVFSEVNKGCNMVIVFLLYKQE